MKDKISLYFDTFSNYYKRNLLRRVLVGLCIGILLWLCFFGTTAIIDFLLWDDIWFTTILNDFPKIGLIIASLVTLQIWGLLPQPINNDNTDNDSNKVNEKTTELLNDTDVHETEVIQE